MKKNFLAVAAVMVSSIFVATTIAQAADVTFSGSMKTRMEVNEQSDFLDSTDADEFIQSRVRLNASANINDSTSAFIQMQSVRTWGEGNAASTFPNPGGSGNASFSPNDADTSVGIHQAYFTLKNFATLPVDMQLGRQEVVLDGHRLFGNTLWTIGAQTHDAVRLTHKHDNMTLIYAYIRGQEQNRTADPSDLSDVDAHLAYLNYQGVLGGTFSATYAYLNDGCGNANNAGTACTNLANDIHSIGFRQAGQLYGIDYRGEFNYQAGDARGTAAAINTGTGNTTFTAGNDIDREAYMFGVRIGKSFENVMLKPKLTLWYDYLSGTSEEDARNNEVGSFNTLFDTGHKFYGLMDNYLGIGAGGNSGTDGLGLQDVAIKTQISPMPGWTLEANYHFFYTAEGYAATANGIGDNDNDLGTELDVTLVNKYNANTKIVVGYSNYSTSTTFRQIKNTGGDSADWAYLMFDVNF